MVAYLFDSLVQVRAITESWLETYNTERSQESLGQLPPLMFLPRPETAQSPVSQCLASSHFPRACAMRRVSAVCCRRTTLPSRIVQKCANRDCTFRPFFVTPK